jgi:catalase
VNADIPAMYQVGIFKTPGVTYPAFLRFSGFDQETQNITDTKGLAIKLYNVPGKKLLPGFEDDTHHDFVFNAFPVFTFNNETTFAAGVMGRTELGGGGDRLRAQFGAMYPENANLDKIQKINNTVASQLLMPYYAISPYKFGLAPLPSPAVKYRIYPCSGVLPYINATDPNPNYLTNDMTTRLAANSYCFYFQLQFQKNACDHPINDFTVEWTEQSTPYITVATINIPVQTVLTDTDATCKHAAMNAWRVLPEHRPLGSLNRARLFAMINSHNQRLALDNVVEPVTGKNHPGLQFWVPEELGTNANFQPAKLKVNFAGNPYAYVFPNNNTGPGAKGLVNEIPTPTTNPTTGTTTQEASNDARALVYSAFVLFFLALIF